MTSVRTNLAVLRRHPDLDPETRRRVLEDLETETEELVGLVEEVVALARGATDETPASRIELGELARTVAARAERRHGAAGQRDGRRLRRRGVAAGGGAGDLQPGRQRRQVRPERRPDRRRRRRRSVVVHDRGPGIAPEDRERVFDRFYRAEGARSLPGSGLGLSIVREVAERNGGTRAVAGPSGRGGVGRACLPAPDRRVAPNAPACARVWT